MSISIPGKLFLGLGELVPIILGKTHAPIRSKIAKPGRPTKINNSWHTARDIDHNIARLKITVSYADLLMESLNVFL